jgi:flagellar basal body-associated protein FliL
MNKKAQGLPITTIALIIIVIVVLAAVTIFFFSYFGKSSDSTKVLTCRQLCEGERSYYASANAWRNLTMSEFCKQGCSGIITCTYEGALPHPC